MTAIMILSDKSSGSSILQKELTKNPQVHTVNYTRHYEVETLFWVKAAAALGLPQDTIHYSEVPFGKEFATYDLSRFLIKNIPEFQFKFLNKETIFGAWTALCSHFGPFFIEKSPHHLHVKSALDLISEYMATEMQEMKFVGIIRNPMDTLYSSWKRWGANPELSQSDWLRAYKNLVAFQIRHPDCCLIIRYEDLVSDDQVLTNICRFLGIEQQNKMGADLHDKSKGKWKKDKLFGFQLKPEVAEFAKRFKYTDTNTNSKQLWHFYHLAHISKMKIKHALKLNMKYF